MPKHDTRNIKPNIIKKEDFDRIMKEEYDYQQSLKTKKIVALIDAKIHVIGKYSGREYLFNGAGSVVDVDERDVEWMLEKRQGERQCCGGTDKGNQMFALAEV